MKCSIVTEIDGNLLNAHLESGDVFPLSVEGEVGPRLNCRVREIVSEGEGLRAAVDFCSYRDVAVRHGELHLPERILVIPEGV